MPVTLGAKPDHGFDEPLGLLSDCHRRIESFLGVLWNVSNTCRGGVLDNEQRSALRQSLDYFQSAAPRHTQDEEVSLFPRLRMIDDPRVHAVMHAVERLEADHRTANARHERVHALVESWLRDGQLSAAEVTELIDLVAALRDLYRDHIAQEDDCVFPLAAQCLSPDQIVRIGEEMASRRGLRTGLSNEKPG